MKRRHNNGGRFKNAKTQAQNITAFLAAYKRSGLVKHAARAVGINHANHYNWLAVVPGYRERFEKTHEEVVAKLGPDAEAEAYARAIEGEKSLVIFEGKPVMAWVDEDGEYTTPPADPDNPGGCKLVLYQEVKKSDGLLQFLLKAVYPEKYGDKTKVDHTSGGQPIQLAPIRLDGEKTL